MSAPEVMDPSAESRPASLGADRVLGGIAVLLAAAMGWACWDYAAPVAYEPVGPRAFPLLLAAMMAACGAWLALRPGPEPGPVSRAQLRSIGACAAVILAYALLFQVLGFILATALMTLPVGRIFGGSWKQSALAGIGMGAALHVLFDTLLDVVLPLGVLKPLLTPVGL